VKLGLNNPYEILRGVGSTSAYGFASLPAPAGAVGYQRLVPSGGWPVALNNQLGDCTIAGVDHLFQAHAAEVKVWYPYPGDPVVRSTYFGLTGGLDAGLQLTDVIRQGATDGLFGHKIVGAAAIHAQDVTALKQTIDFWGAAYAAVTLPRSAQQQFHGDGSVWSPVPGSPIEGGHCITHVGYDNQFVYTVTWGAVVALTWEWWATYGIQAFALVTDFFVQAGHGPTNQLDLRLMESDLKVLAA
jgi:hypothetical protein